MSLTLLQRWESTIAQSLHRNLVAPVTSMTPATDDPLVKMAKMSQAQGKTAPLAALGQNTVGFENLTRNTDTTSDPLVVDSFKTMGSLDSAQKQLASSPYNKNNFYSSRQSNGPLLFRGKPPSDVIPIEGRPADPRFHGGNLYNSVSTSPLATFAPIASTMPSSMFNSVDIFALAQYARNIAMEFGIVARPNETQGERLRGLAKGATFLGTQFLLSTFNPADPQNGGPLNMVYNPLSFPASFIPGLRGNALSSPNLPAALSVDGKAYSTIASTLPDALDRHLLMRQGLYVKATNASDIANGSPVNFPGFIGDISKPGPAETLGPLRIPGVNGVPIAAQVSQDDFLGSVAKVGPYMTNMYSQERPYSQEPAIDNEYIESRMEADPNVDPQQIIMDALFKQSSVRLPSIESAISSKSVRDTKQYRWYAGFNKGLVKSKPTSYPTSVDAAFPQEQSDCTILESQAISDDDNYMPFTFQDLRDSTPSLLYFRAFLKEGLGETFQPNWQSEGFYGRVDEVPTYMNTSRTIQIAFDVVAWAPKDLPVVWKKLTKLQSLVYPSYDSGRYLQAGPLVRMRVGDLFTADKGQTKRGLPGYISSMNFAYDDNVWNVKKDFKVPRKISVSLGFVVIHDGNPGVYLDDFGGSVFGTLEYRDGPTPSVYPGGVRGLRNSIPTELDELIGLDK